MVSTKAEAAQSKIEETLSSYFEQKSKFFGSNNTNSKKAFFCLGQYTKQVMTCMQKHVVENGGENKFETKVTKFATYKMSYRNFTMLTKLLDSYDMKCNLIACSGFSKKYLINTEFVSDKNALSTEDANLAFSLGLYQNFQ
jgi:hypothetical protein